MRTDSPSEAEKAQILEWTRSTVDEMVAAGYVELPVAISDAMYDYLLDLFLLGLKPAEAAQAAFATRH